MGPTTPMQIQVEVHPRARRNVIEVVEGSRLRVYLTAPPEGGKANAALLANRLGVTKGSIRIVRGHRARDKLLDIEGPSAQEVIARLSS